MLRTVVTCAVMSIVTLWLSNAQEVKPSVEPKTVNNKTALQTADDVLQMSVVASRSEKAIFDVPHQVNVVTNDDFVYRTQTTNNFVDTLKELPGFQIQKTGRGQGSPFIRGFTGFRNVLMIDGVRFNNSIFREGPNQYWSTIDPLFLNRIDVLRGPGSVLYGSDAIGGAVNAITKSTDTWSNKTEIGGQIYYRFAEAERSNIGHLELKGSHKNKVGWIFGGSFKDNDDFRAGGGSGQTEYTSYQDLSLNGKIEYRPFNRHELTFYVDRFRQNDAPRTEQTIHSIPYEGTRIGVDRKHEFDQNRLLSYLKYKVDGMTEIFEEAEVILSYQNTMEDLFRIDNARRRRFSDFEVNTYGGQIQMTSEVPIMGTMIYGVDYFHDFVESSGKRFNRDGSLNRVEIQGPVGDDSSASRFGAFIRDEKNLFDDMLTLTAGGRFEYNTIDVGKYQEVTTGRKASQEDDWDSLVGSFQFLMRPDHKSGDHWRIFGGVQQSFRSPSLHDLSALSTGATIEQPATGLEPEEYTTLELGFKTEYKSLPVGDRIAIESSYYYTFIHSQILRQPTGEFQGNTPVVEKVNGGKGWINGIELSLQYDFLKDFRLWGNVTFQEGDIMQFHPDFKKRRGAADRIIPIMSHMGLMYRPHEQRWWVELHADLFSDADRIGIGNRFDTRRIPPGGTPGFGVFGIRGGARFLKDRMILTGGIENIANEDYRIHGSGQNEPGINFKLSLTYNW